LCCALIMASPLGSQWTFSSSLY
ncbi:uncharacterized, partial [Tachysurus ichikawai]